MADRVRVFGRDGVGLCDLRVTVERNWSVNSESEAEFDIVFTDPNCRDDYLRFGNWLLVENDKLEPWVGMIDVPQEWKQRAVHVTAYSPERIMAYRNVPRQLPLTGKSGTVFQELINITNRAEVTVIEAGDIWTGGNDLPDEQLSGDSLQDYLSSLVSRSGGEYSFTPVTSKGKLTIKANWYKRMGFESNLALEESYNLSDEHNTIRVQKQFWNSGWGYGNGAGQADRPTATYTDPASAGLYGVRENSRVYSDYTNVGAVENAIRTEVNENRLPRKVFKLSAVDVGSTFPNLRLGNTYPLRMWSVGFGVDTQVRVNGMYFNPFRGKVDLNVEEITDDSVE